jgi:hypothetical protein
MMLGMAWGPLPVVGDAEQPVLLPGSTGAHAENEPLMDMIIGVLARQIMNGRGKNVGPGQKGQVV